MNNPQPKLVKVFVTENSLTSGVFKAEAEISDCGRFAVVKNLIGVDAVYILGKSAFFTAKKAKANFEKRKTSAIRSAKKKLQKLKNLEFKPQRSGLI